MSEQINTLHRINSFEKSAIIEGLQLLAAKDTHGSWIAKILLEEKYRFVECLFWAGERDSKF